MKASGSIRTATPASMRAINRSIVLELIRRKQPVSRADLARLTGIFRSNVSGIVDELVEEGLVIEKRSLPSGRGRVPMSLRLNDAAHPVLGVNLRPKVSQITASGLRGRLGPILDFETPGSPRELVAAIAGAVTRISAQVGVDARKHFRRIGMAVPGFVERSTSRIVWTPTHAEWTGLAIADEVERRTGIPACADNDCNAGALSELRMIDGQQADFVFLNVGDHGAGAGVVLNGQIYVGHNGRFAAEVGHMVVSDSGSMCYCGRRGCWETYVSNEAAWHRYRPRTRFTPAAFEEMLAAAKAGDAEARHALRETAHWLALGIANIAFLMNPAEVVFSGRLTEVWNVIGPRLQAEYAAGHVKTRVRPASLSADSSLLHGAVCLALHDIFALPQFGGPSGSTVPVSALA